MNDAGDATPAAAVAEPEIDGRTTAADVQARFHDFLVRAAIRGSAELRGVLPIDEDAFRHVSLRAHGDAKAYFLYGAVDEAARAGVALLGWADLVSGERGETPPADALERVTLGSVLTEQKLWWRKLIEGLTSLICFEATNEEIYFRDLLLLEQLRAHLFYRQDLRDFYAQRFENLELGAHILGEQVRQNEANLDPAKVEWYRKIAIPLPKDPHPARLLQTFRFRLVHALDRATPLERMLLGITYSLYSEASDAIHFNVVEPHRQWSTAAIRQGLHYTALLCVSVLLRVCRLAEIEPDDDMVMISQLARTFGSGKLEPKHLEMIMGRRAGVGDFVLARGFLAEVTAVDVSRFGYRSYKCVYLVERPLQDIEEEWVLPYHVHKLFDRGTVVEQVKSLLEDAGVQPAPEVLADSTRESVTKAWRMGLREAVLRRRR